GEGLVRFRPAMSVNLPQLRQQLAVTSDELIGNGVWRHMRSDTLTTQAMLATLGGRGEVLQVEPNYVLHATAVPNDPQFSLLWGLRNLTTPGADIHAVNAWNVSTGSSSIVVGVVDTGIDYNHPDLQANVWSAPSQFTVTLGAQTLTCPAGSHGVNT